ncbi:MAG: TonB-dependent receptor [Bacteroides sp.]|nr:TonB-dependent receptor [Bacteroides sp.]
MDGRSWTQYICVGVLGLLIHINAFSQTVETDSVAERERKLETVTVTANRVHKSVTSTAPVQILSQEALQHRGVTDIADALRRFSGVNVKDYGGAGGMKTVSVRSLGSQHTAVVYDGMTVTDCQSGQIDLSRFSLDNIKSLSLTVGDNDDIFQPARTVASAASVRLQSKAPQLEEKSYQLKAEVKAGSFGLANPFLRYDQRLSEKTTMSVSGDYMRADNLYPFELVNGKYVTEERRNNNAIETWRGEWNLYARPGVRSSLNAKIYYYDSYRQLPGQVVLYNDVSNEELSDRNFFTQMNYRTYWNNGLSLQVNGKFNWGYSHYHDEAPEYPGGVQDNIYYQREYYASAALLYEPLEALAFAYAADYAYGNLNSNSSTDVRPYRHTLLQTLTARFRTSQLSVTAMLLGSIYLNGAKKGESASDERRLSPSLSLSWQPLKSSQFYVRASYKDIFRVATFTENYFDRWGSRNLQPETARQYNLGVTYDLKKSGWFTGFRFSADGYYNYVKNKIVAMPRNMFFWTMVNLGRVDIWGADVTADFSFRPADKHTLLSTLSYTYQHAVDKTDAASAYYNDQIPYTPEHSGSLSLAWENPWLNLSFHGTGVGKRYSSEQNVKANELKGYIECGLACYRNFRWLRTDWAVRADLINLFNKQYCIVKNYPMPGRSYKLTLSITL